MTGKDIYNEAMNTFRTQQHFQEIADLLDFLLANDIKNVMEIGLCFRCNALCLGAVASGKKIFVDIGVDTIADYKLSNTFENCTIVIGNSHSQDTKDEIVAALDGELFDFIFVDGDHSYEGVKKDYEMYWELVKPGGWMAFHDINDSDMQRVQGCFVAQLWNELQGEKLEFNAHENWAGVGLIRK